jgi:hypothetical protein
MASRNRSNQTGNARILCRTLVLCALPAMPMLSLAQAPVPCNPVVHLSVEKASLAKTLAGLAQAHDFTLVFPDSVDRPITLDAELPLDRMLKRLTNGISTSYLYADRPACDGNQIMKLVVYPVGEEGKALRTAGGRNGNPNRPVTSQDYIYVDDMDQYVTEVLTHKRHAELVRLTPEQRLQYREARKRLKKELEPELKRGNMKPSKSSEQKSSRSSQAVAAPAE